MNDAHAGALDEFVVYDPVDPFENRAGPFYWQQEADGTHVFALSAESRHCNTHEIVHGGLLVTMIDLAMVAAGKAVTGEVLVTVSLSTEFLSAGRAGDLLYARGEVTRRTRSLAFTRGLIQAGGTSLITASAVYKRLART